MCFHGTVDNGGFHINDEWGQSVPIVGCDYGGGSRVHILSRPGTVNSLSLCPCLCVAESLECLNPM